MPSEQDTSWAWGSEPPPDLPHFLCFSLHSPFLLYVIISLTHTHPPHAWHSSSAMQSPQWVKVAGWSHTRAAPTSSQQLPEQLLNEPFLNCGGTRQPGRWHWGGEDHGWLDRGFCLHLPSLALAGWDCTACGMRLFGCSTCRNQPVNNNKMYSIALFIYCSFDVRKKSKKESISRKSNSE